MTIVAYTYYTPVFWFPLCRKQLNHNLTEFTARKQGAVSNQWTTQVKDLFSILRQQAANFQISTIWLNALHWHKQNKFCLSKNGIAKQYCISLEKENYNDIGRTLDFRQENEIRIKTLLQR